MDIDLTQITGAEYNQLSEKDKLRVMTKVYRQLCYDSISQHALDAINVFETLGINDYENHRSDINLPLGFLRAGAMILKQCFMQQCRHELQVMQEDTQYAARLTEEIYSSADKISNAVEDMILLQTYYDACLSHRRENNVNLIDDDGLTVPYTEETIMRQELIEKEQEQSWKERLREERAELERAYAGEAPPPPLPEGYETCQMVIPLWKAGFAVV